MQHCLRKYITMKATKYFSNTIPSLALALGLAAAGYSIIAASDSEAVSSINQFLAQYFPANNTQQELADKILRFHVRANSDTEADQAQKLEVKEAVLDYLAPLLADADSKEEVCDIIEAHLPEITEVGEAITCPEETGRYVTASVTNCYFPIKAYGDMTFPSGYYDALEIEIGGGEGHNWWCVMYPQLCFVDMCYGTVPEESKEELHSHLSDSTYESLFTTQSSDGAQDTSPESSVKPRIGFWFTRFFSNNEAG